MQLKLNHGYFKVYLHRLRHTETNLCTYKQKQTSEHLIVQCQNYETEQEELKQKLNQKTLSFKYLTKTQLNLTSLIKYIQKTLVATRKWQLDLMNLNLWQQKGEWGEVREMKEEEEEEEEKKKEEE